MANDGEWQLVNLCVLLELKKPRSQQKNSPRIGVALGAEDGCVRRQLARFQQLGSFFTGSVDVLDLLHATEMACPAASGESLTRLVQGSWLLTSSQSPATDT